MTGRAGRSRDVRNRREEVCSDVAEEIDVERVGQSPFRMSIEDNALAERRHCKRCHSRSRRPRSRSVAAGSDRSAISHALPNATRYGTFSVPARRPPSCPAPWMKGSSLAPRRTNSTPTPFGAYSLCPATVSRSTPSSLTSTGTLPSDWAASVWTRMPRSLAISAISRIGCSVPTSLLECMTADEPRFAVDGPAHRVGIDAADAVHRQDRHLAAESLKKVARLKRRGMLDGGGDDVDILAEEPAEDALERGEEDALDGLVARLSAAAGEDDLVGMGAEQSRPPVDGRARRLRGRSCRRACVLDGLPKCVCRYGSIASRTAGSSGVVAL